jgi:type VI secretion system protein ImpF
MVFPAVVASLFDRLISPDASVSASGACTRNSYIDAVVRDLEFLLNSRTTLRHNKASTLLDYGIPDSIGLNILALADRQQLIADISQAIQLFEPRLKQVEVSFLGHLDGGRRMLLAISATVSISGVAERIVFKTQFQPVGSVYSVQRG